MTVNPREQPRSSCPSTEHADLIAGETGPPYEAPAVEHRRPRDPDVSFDDARRALDEGAS